MKTIFQKIIDHEIPSRIEHEDEQCVVVHDIQPQAPVHLLIV
ncbi:MAG: HIT domain-containing protein, partial [Opitutaceae bacterium]